MRNLLLWLLCNHCLFFFLQRQSSVFINAAADNDDRTETVVIEKPDNGDVEEEKEGSSIIGSSSSSSSEFPKELDGAKYPSGFCVHELVKTRGAPRSIISAPSFTNLSDMLYVERDNSVIILLHDSDGDGTPETPIRIIRYERETETGYGLNHGLAWHDGYLYASSSTKVLRWLYPASGVTGPIDLTSSQYEIVIDNMSADGNGGAPLGHYTRSLIFDPNSNDVLYVAIGSNNNIDPDSFRARIRRFHLNDANVLFPIDFTTGEVFADGVRNTVGMAFDKYGRLWGVDAGPDNLIRNDIGGDIHNDNPGEELNLLLESNAGKHYGYPYCWSEGNLVQYAPNMALGKGTQWLWPGFDEADNYSDTQCRNTNINIPPQMIFQSHSSPLGMTFYNYNPNMSSKCDSSKAFPQSMDGYAFIAFHGSWNRDVPVGYYVGYIKVNSDGDLVDIDVEGQSESPGVINLLYSDNGSNAVWNNGLRPVDVDFDQCGRLFISSDGTLGVGEKVLLMEASDSCYDDKNNDSDDNDNNDSGGSSSVCYSSANTVQVKGYNKPTKMNDLRVGDEVLTTTGTYQTVYAFGKRQPNKVQRFLQFHVTLADASTITTAAAEQLIPERSLLYNTTTTITHSPPPPQQQQPPPPLEVTDDHMVFVIPYNSDNDNDNRDNNINNHNNLQHNHYHNIPIPVPAKTIQIGDKIQAFLQVNVDNNVDNDNNSGVGDGSSSSPTTVAVTSVVVTKIVNITRNDGIYNPLTVDGTLLVNNGMFQTSIYSAIFGTTPTKSTTNYDYNDDDNNISHTIIRRSQLLPTAAQQHDLFHKLLLPYKYFCLFRLKIVPLLLSLLRCNGNYEYDNNDNYYYQKQQHNNNAVVAPVVQFAMNFYYHWFQYQKEFNQSIILDLLFLLAELFHMIFHLVWRVALFLLLMFFPLCFDLRSKSRRLN